MPAADGGAGRRIRPSWRSVRFWVVVAAAVALAVVVLQLLHVSGAPILGGIIGAAAVSLTLGRRSDLAPSVSRLAQVVLGVAIGTTIGPEALGEIGASWPGYVVVLVGTVLLGMLAGLVLQRWTRVDGVTAQLGMLTGGASGITAMSADVGADARLVSVMQYLRVYLVIALLPFVSRIFPGDPARAADAVTLRASGGGPVALGLAAVVGSVLLVLLINRVADVPSLTVLLPMVVTTVLRLTVPGFDPAVPAGLEAGALVVIGVQTGLAFTVAALRQAGRMLPLLIAAILLMIAACAGLGLVLAAITGTSPLDGYLATTPGGIYAVLGVAVQSDVDVAFVSTAQVLRVFVVLLTAPLLARWFRRRGPGRAGRPVDGAC
ncbi:AbrB family transcriptional regulator [Nakamurella leprariae]|uniref:AbrB family transcriptional regulator n=1 Tax=Nakamurella leprariae TaxID=2803911 RepID=A0A938YC01_9ACTN|nr:AbrB family transcriptional regulator [Nakamurella leprariae]MBM9466806.1 AbrB family transcriptional regulator [Nakamurella leprariae]